jgi:hypothetical protein
LQVVIEKRVQGHVKQAVGEKGMVVAPGSPLAVHPSGRPYVLLQGDLSNIPTISPEDRKRMLDVARGFNLYVKPPRVQSRPTDLQDGTNKSITINREGQTLLQELYGLHPRLKPGEDFNARADWRDILEPLGWHLVTTRGDTSYWRKPNKQGPSHHATTNHKGHDMLYNFSSSIAGIEAGRGYTKFTIYAIFHCAGDFGKAARELARKGFGG